MFYLQSAIRKGLYLQSAIKRGLMYFCKIHHAHTAWSVTDRKCTVDSSAPPTASLICYGCTPFLYHTHHPFQRYCCVYAVCCGIFPFESVLLCLPAPHDLQITTPTVSPVIVDQQHTFIHLLMLRVQFTFWWNYFFFLFSSAIPIDTVFIWYCLMNIQLVIMRTPLALDSGCAFVSTLYWHGS